MRAGSESHVNLVASFLWWWRYLCQCHSQNASLVLAGPLLLPGDSKCGAVVTISLLFCISWAAVLYFAALVWAFVSSLRPFLPWLQLPFPWWPVDIVSPLWLFPVFCCLCQSWILPPQGWEQFPWKDSVVPAGLRSLELILGNGLFIQPIDDGCAYLREVCTVITAATAMVQTTLLIKYWCACSIVK